MSKIIKINKGLDINLLGKADAKVTALPMADSYAVSPLDFEGVVPKLLVKAGEQVKKCTVCEYVLETKESQKDFNNTSVVFKLEAEGKTARDCTAEELMLLNAPEERELIRFLSSLYWY